jgi:hypothetical protein
MMKKHKIPVHPILLSFYPIVFLLAHNLQFLRIESSYRSLSLSFWIIIFFLVSFQIILRNWEKAGAICTLLIILFYSYGHILNQLNNWTANLDLYIYPSHLAWLCLVVFLSVLFLIVKNDFPKIFTKYLNIISMILIVFPISIIVFFKLSILNVDQ